MSSKKLLWLLPLSLLAACSSVNRDNNQNSSSSIQYASAKTDSMSAVAPAPAAEEQSGTFAGTSGSAATPLNSPQRKIIHTADFHCSVRNVFYAATQLEKLVKSVGGVVQESHMENSDCETKTSYYTADSLMQTKIYTTTAQLTLRVPDVYLDSVINCVPGLCSFIDSRTLKQSDATYEYLSNELKNEADDSKAADRAMQLSKKSKDPLEVQQYRDDRQEQKIDRKIANMNLLDDVHYATLTVAISQPQQVFTQIVVNPDYYTATPFSVECKTALSDSWTGIKAFVVFLMRIWPVLFLGVAGFIIIRRMRYRQVVLAKK